jgi:hypothetical protein
MALNPSNNSVREGTPFPVLGDPPFRLDRAETAREELHSVIPEEDLTFRGKMSTREVYRKGTKGYRMGRAGVSMYYEGQENDIETIEVASVTAEAYGWTFHRLWYYWVCQTNTNPIPQAKAEDLNVVWGKQVRFDGFAGGHDVDGPGDHYHVDTKEGLQALLNVIKPKPAPGPVPDVWDRLAASEDPT